MRPPVLSDSLLEDEEYLLFEDINRVITINSVRGKCTRQFMRYLVARSIGKPELCNWAAYPGWDKILRDKAHYQAFLPDALGVDLSGAHWLETEGLQS